jgi:hypothetical protein
MKKSNLFIVIGLILCIASIIFYDFSLKAEYESGSYKIPFRNFQDLSFKDFDILDINSSTAANAKFVQGPFSVRIAKDAMDFVRVKQNGRRLQINADFSGDYLFNPNQYLLVISCPKLVEVNTDATYRSNGRPVTDSAVRIDWRMRQVLIDGFTQDSLTIGQDYASTVVFANNHIRSVHAVIGRRVGSGSNMIIEKTNQFQHAFIDIGQKSKLFLESAQIDDFKYQLDSSAQLIVIGKAKNLLNDTKSQGK